MYTQYPQTHKAFLHFKPIITIYVSIINVHLIGSKAFSPQNLTITNKTSTSLTVEWSPPLTPNGVILSYQVFYVGLESVNPVPDSFETNSTLTTSAATQTVEVAGLSHYSRYSLSVKAFTSAGG